MLSQRLFPKVRRAKLPSTAWPLNSIGITAPWAVAHSSLRDPTRRLPQAIAHRGAKVDWPENTMAAFRGAVTAGAHAIETDVHLSSDGVAVISHVSQSPTSTSRCEIPMLLITQLNILNSSDF